MPKLSPITQDLILRSKAYQQGMADANKKLKRFQGRTGQAGKAAAQFSGTMKRLGGLALGAAGIGGIGSLIQSSMDLGREIKVLSSISNAGFEDFQRLAHGAKQYNVEQTKLADILKDTNDKVGDFLQTGGGPMRDFFENIAPKVGITADMFRGLSGPDALQLYYDGLQKANLSQQDMTFYMEAIASDATALIPLLHDGGSEFKRLGEQATIMARNTAERLAHARNQIDKFKQSATIKVGELIAGEADGAAVKILTAQLLGATAQFSVGILEGIYKLADTIPTFIGGAMEGVANKFGFSLKTVAIKFKIALQEGANAVILKFNELSGANIQTIRVAYRELAAEQAAAGERIKSDAGILETAMASVSDLWSGSPLDAWKKDIDSGTAAIVETYQGELDASRKVTEERKKQLDQMLGISDLPGVDAEGESPGSGKALGSLAKVSTAANGGGNAMDPNNKSGWAPYVAALKAGITPASGKYDEFVQNFKSGSDLEISRDGNTMNKISEESSQGALASIISLLTEIRNEMVNA
jgi:hypothetical protein